MPEKFFKKVGDVVNSPYVSTVNPLLPILFDVFGGNRGRREDLLNQASTPLPQEAALMNMLRERVQQNPNAQVSAVNERILDTAKRERGESQRESESQLLNRLGDAGLIDSGIAQRGFQDIAREGGRDIQNLATQLGTRAEDLRRQFDQERLQAQQGLATFDRELEGRRQAVENELKAERAQAYQNFANMIGLALSIAVPGAGGIAGAGLSQGTQQLFSGDLLQQLDQFLGNSFSDQPPIDFTDPGFNIAPPVAT